MAPSIKYSNEFGSKPVWLQTNLGVDQMHVHPGGIQLNPAAFTFAVGAPRIVKAGTLVGRTYAERDAGTGFGPYAATDNQIFLLFNDVDFDEGVQGDGLIPYRGNVIAVNFLPGWATLPQPEKDYILANYDTFLGRP